MRAPSVAQRKTWRFRLYPTAAQRAVLDGHLWLCCELYNAALQERRDAWRMVRVSIGFTQQSAQLPALKAERSDVAGVYSQVLQDVLHRVDRAFGGFFARVRRGDRPGFPTVRGDLRALNGYHSAQVDVDVRLNTNESPLPPPPKWFEAFSQGLTAIDFNRYPDRQASALRRAP